MNLEHTQLLAEQKSKSIILDLKEMAMNLVTIKNKGAEDIREIEQFANTGATSKLMDYISNNAKGIDRYFSEMYYKLKDQLTDLPNENYIEFLERIENANSIFELITTRNVMLIVKNKNK